jgi:hypothetical protein
MTSWATPDDVQSLTGKTVDDAEIDIAAGIIEVSSAIGDAATKEGVILSTRNKDWLRRATAYQAAFMADHPDYFSRMDVDSFTQDGATASIKADGLVLAPMARRCIKRLSWTGVRTVFSRDQQRPLSRFGDRPPYTSDDYDDSLPYKPL